MTFPDTTCYINPQTETALEMARLKLESDEAVLGKLVVLWKSGMGEKGKRKIFVKHKVPYLPSTLHSIISFVCTLLMLSSLRFLLR